MRCKIMLGSVIAMIATSKAQAIDIGSYFVESHGSCNINLPGTKTEVRDFVASRPSFIDWNHTFGDANVWPADWMSDTDWYISSANPNLFDGADSTNLVYVATHGVTQNNVFTMGVNALGTCGVNSSAMNLGNQRARYLFLSTCQSLRAGDGANPGAPNGSSPASTWASHTAGIRCIFGYSTDMRDDPRYGKLFWQKWNRVGTPTSKAFLDSSWDVNQNQVPMVMCYGQTTADANALVEREENFSIGRPSNAYATIRWYRPSSTAALGSAKLGPLPVPKELTLGGASRALSAAAYPEAVPGRPKSAAATRDDAPAETRTVVETEYGFHFSDSDEVHLGTTVRFDDTRAVELAREHLEARGLWRDDLLVGAIRHEGQMSSEETEGRLVGIAVEFKQQLAPGLLSLDSPGRILVELNGRGRVAAVDVATVQVAREPGAGLALAANVLPADREGLLRAEASRLWPGRSFALLDIVTGYRTEGDHATLVHRALVDFGQGSRKLTVELPVK